MPATKPVAIAFIPPDGDQEYVYPRVPPVTLAVAVPFEPPLQDTLVCEEAVAVKADDGCVIVKLCVVVQLFASVTVQV
jgi:hypothetical protein